jgi:lysine 2,3-aminomutase
MAQFLNSHSAKQIILRNYEGVITTYTEPKHMVDIPCTCDYCTGKKEYVYEGVAGLSVSDKLTIEPADLERHKRNHRSK